MRFITIISIALLLVVAFVAIPALAQEDPFGEDHILGETGGRDTGKIVPCDGVDDPCSFSDLFVLASRLMDYVVTYIVGPVAAVMLIVAGIFFVTDAGSGKRAEKAKNIFTTTVKGIVLVLASYLIVKVLVVGLISKSGGNSESGKRLLDYFNSIR